MKKLPILIAIIVILILCILLLPILAPKTGSIEINIIDPQYVLESNIYLLEGTSDSPDSRIIQKVEGINLPNTITLTDIPPGVYTLSSQSKNYIYRLIFPDCNECNLGEPPIVEVIAGKITKVTIKPDLMVYGSN